MRVKKIAILQSVADQKIAATIGRLCIDKAIWNLGWRPGNELPVQEVVEHFIECWGSGEYIDASDPSQPPEANILLHCLELCELHHGRVLSVGVAGDCLDRQDGREHGRFIGSDVREAHFPNRCWIDQKSFEPLRSLVQRFVRFSFNFWAPANGLYKSLDLRPDQIDNLYSDVG